MRRVETCASCQSRRVQSQVRSLNPFFPLFTHCPYTAQPDRHEAVNRVTTTQLTLSTRPRGLGRLYQLPKRCGHRSYTSPSNCTRRCRLWSSFYPPPRLSSRNADSVRVNPFARHWSLANHRLRVKDGSRHRWQRELGYATRRQWALNKMERRRGRSTGHGL